MEEIWKDIKDFEGYYQISNMGRVKSLERETIYGRGAVRITEEKILKQFYTLGYPRVALVIKGQYKKCLVHHLVWDAFGDKSRNGHKLQVDHINNIKDDSRIENLQLLTSRENIDKMYAEKYKRLPKGVSFITTEGKYRAQYRTKSGVIKFIGRYNDPELAHKAYLNFVSNLEVVDAFN